MAATRRIQKEVVAMQESNSSQFQANPAGDDLFQWEALIYGPEGTPYEGGVFVLDIKLPTEYPFRPPTVEFKTNIYHPNVKDGKICSDILKDQWTPMLYLSDVLVTIHHMLLEPNPDTPLRPEVGHQYKTDREAFNAAARECTHKYALA